MRWRGRRQSDNVEDRRGVSGGHVAVGGGIIEVIILVINMLMGGDGTDIINQIQPGQQQNTELTAEDIEMRDFVETVLADTEDVWTKIFDENGMTYEQPKLVLF